MRFKTFFELCCLSHHTLCNIFFCNYGGKSYSKNQRARIIYSIFMFLNILLWLWLRTGMDAYLYFFYGRYSCIVELDFLSCFEVNMLLRNSFSLVLFFALNAFLVGSRNKFSIYFNEKLWLVKICMYIFCFVASMSMSLYFMFSFAIFSKYLSIGILILQLIIVHDSILIMLDKNILPALNQNKCGKITKICLGYVLPIILGLGMMVLNFATFMLICSTYMAVTLITVILSAILLAVNLMRILEANIISSIWFIAITQVMAYSMQASTGVSSCINQDTGELTATWDAILWDTLLSKPTPFLQILIFFRHPHSGNHADFLEHRDKK